jgi:NitT/TauT family transport system ATP-binding protein
VGNAPHIVIEGLDVGYESSRGRLVALKEVSLRVEPGEFLSILGPSGCGKSTLLRVIGGLLAPSAGAVFIDGRRPQEAQRRREIGFVFQDPSLLPWRTVLENVRLPLQISRGPSSADPHDLVRLVGLEAFEHYYPHQLSGGMQQRVALARSLVTEPSLLLMDEPFGALDEMTRRAMRFELLRVWSAAAAGRPCTVVFVTHSIEEAVTLSDRVVVMTPRPGQIAGLLTVDLPRPREAEADLDSSFLDRVRRLRALLGEWSLV